MCERKGYLCSQWSISIFHSKYFICLLYLLKVSATFQSFLEDDSILKVGIATLDDSTLLAADYCLKVLCHLNTFNTYIGYMLK